MPVVLAGRHMCRSVCMHTVSTAPCAIRLRSSPCPCTVVYVLIICVRVVTGIRATVSPFGCLASTTIDASPAGGKGSVTRLSTEGSSDAVLKREGTGRRTVHPLSVDQAFNTIGAYPAEFYGMSLSSILPVPSYLRMCCY